MVENLIFCDTMVELEDLEAPGPAKHIRLTRAGQNTADKFGYCQIFAQTEPGFRKKVNKLYGAERCDYCRRKISPDKETCPGCGASY
jgi:hypothetical protein